MELISYALLWMLLLPQYSVSIFKTLSRFKTEKCKFLAVVMKNLKTKNFSNLVKL